MGLPVLLGIENVYGGKFLEALQQKCISHMILIKICVEKYMEPNLFIAISTH
jgi:hypothetical protein